MEIKNLSKPSLNILDKYLNFKFGSATCSIPYFNNKRNGNRAALKVYIGKGSPHDLGEELEIIASRNKIKPDSLNQESLKKLLVDNGLGIECSGFCYHLLDSESKDHGYGGLAKNLRFINCKGLIGQIRCSIRPTENCDVKTFADNSNSTVVSLEKIRPGDFITMIASTQDQSKENDHILIIYEVEYSNSLPQRIKYAHSIAYPEDGIYSTGIRTGTIEIRDHRLPINQQKWVEDKKEGDNNILFLRIQKQKTEIRRLSWF